MLVELHQLTKLSLFGLEAIIEGNQSYQFRPSTVSGRIKLSSERAVTKHVAVVQAESTYFRLDLSDGFIEDGLRVKADPGGVDLLFDFGLPLMGVVLEMESYKRFLLLLDFEELGL